MKKYFMKHSGKEIKFGEEIEVDLSAAMPDGNIRHQHIACVFHPQLVDMFLKKGIIVGKEDADHPDMHEDVRPLIDFSTAELKSSPAEKLTQHGHLLSALMDLRRQVFQMGKALDNIWKEIYGC